MKVERKPEWLKVKLSNTKQYNQVNEILMKQSLHTVCQGANCPNRLECFGKKTATFMILGTECTRHCKFCNIGAGHIEPPDLDEPRRLALAVKEMELKYVVITSVTRDDLEDGGANHFVACINAIRALNDREESVGIEVLIPDLNGDREAITKVVEARPMVINHNIETIERLYREVRPEAVYERSLELFKVVKSINKEVLTKSGFMVGLGEKDTEIYRLIDDLIKAGVDLLTIGQYLPPTKEHYPLVEYVTPEKFDDYKAYAIGKGFIGVASGPLVRSSYHANELINHHQ